MNMKLTDTELNIVENTLISLINKYNVENVEINYVPSSVETFKDEFTNETYEEETNNTFTFIFYDDSIDNVSDLFFYELEQLENELNEKFNKGIFIGYTINED